MNNEIDIHHLSHALTEHGFSLRQRLQIWRSIDVSDFLCGSPGEFLVRAMKRALGEEGQRKLRGLHVCIVGAGGTGSVCGMPPLILVRWLPLFSLSREPGMYLAPGSHLWRKVKYVTPVSPATIGP